MINNIEFREFVEAYGLQNYTFYCNRYSQTVLENPKIHKTFENTKIKT